MPDEIKNTQTPVSSTDGPPHKEETGMPPAEEMPAGVDILLAELRRQARQEFSGTVVVLGEASGKVVLRDGLLTTATTSAAPGLESLLLRSGRISVEEWTAVFAAAAPSGRLPTALVERRLLGSAGVQVVTRMATMDALFALAMTQIDRVAAEPAGAGFLPPVLPVEPGIEVERAIRETSRRLANASRWRAGLGLEPQTRPRLASPSSRRASAGGAQADLLARVDGRRTCRDIAFTVGRGLFPVLTDLASLAGDGRIVLPPPQGRSPVVPRAEHGGASGLPSYGDRLYPENPSGTDVGDSRETRQGVLVDGSLPRRRRSHPPDRKAPGNRLKS
ncbi:hypothetical protein ND748_17345 [Frankia sp. AiPs1]|uniref:hypothetical protein n=1 Tax=Frankia sp. AiPs1 TaxID=573493 RepID=UPI002043515C|nr:hypothetical protein [Frankia sp. AiPs1]MCM3923419.1 hypothetical protein [Frankia sp. AiPs1]